MNRRTLAHRLFPLAVAFTFCFGLLVGGGRAPRSRAICMMLFSTVPPLGVMRVRSSERPMPVLVEKNMSATLELQLPRQADDAPKPSIR